MKNKTMINLSKGISTPLAITIIIASAIVLVGGVYAYQYYYVIPNEKAKVEIEIPKDETAEWNIYKNEEYGFEFKYPVSWSVYDKSLNYYFKYPRNWFRINVGQCAGDIIVGFDLEVADQLTLKSANVPIIDSIKKGETNYILADTQAEIKNIIQDKTKIKFGNYEGHELIATFCYGVDCSANIGPISIIEASINDKTYHIEYSEGIKRGINEWQYYDKFKKVISTFRFLEIPKDETAEWNVYRNEEYGFEIKYPSNTQIGDLIDIFRGKSITFDPSSTEGILEIKILTENPHCPDTALGSDIYNVLINGVSFMKQGASRNYSVVYPYAVAFEYCGIAANGIEYKLVPRIHYTQDQNDINFVLPDVDVDPVLNQMISSFRFIEKDETVD